MSNLNSVAVRRLNKVVVERGSTSEVTPQHMAAFVANLMRLGYCVNSDAMNALYGSTITNLVLIENDLKVLVGDNVNHKPMYPNFPKQVAEASDVELFVNAIMHYFGDAIGARIMPDYVKEARPELKDTVNVTVLGLASESDFDALTEKLVAQGQSYSATDLSDLEVLKDRIKVADVKVKENLINLTVMRSDLDWSNSYKTVTDVLRLARVLSGGDATFTDNVKFKLSRAQRRMILSMLETVLTNNNNNLEDFARYNEEWKRLAHQLHHREYKYAKASAALSEVQQDKVVSFDSKIEDLIKKGRIVAAVELLKDRPGAFARRLNELVRKSGNSKAKQEAVVEAFAKVADKVSTPVLIQLSNYYNGPDSAELARRVVNTRGTKAGTLVIDNKLDYDTSKISEIIENALRSKNTGKKVFFTNDKAAEYAVPLGVRNASEGMRVIGRGSRIKLDDSKSTIRLFMYWHDLYEGDNWSKRVDLDLSGVFVNAEFDKVNAIAYYNLRNEAGYHSGDITSAPEGASEFIDINIKNALANGWRYLIPTVYSYSRQSLDKVPDAFAGFMMRDKVQSGEIYEPATVEHHYNLNVSGVNSTPFVVDLLTREVIWFDSTIKADNSYMYNVANNENSFLLMLESLVKTKYMNVAELADMVSDVVENEEDADLVIDPTQTADVLQLVSAE